MEDLALITALNYSSSFCEHLFKFPGKKKQKCYSAAQVRPYWEKPCPLS